jgi:hypothetical protein
MTPAFRWHLISARVVLNGDRGFAAELPVDTVNGETAP